MKNGKMVILVKIRNFSRSRMTKRTSPLKSSRKSSYHVEFSRIPRRSEFHVFRGDRGNARTWHIVSGLRGATCQAMSKSNNELKSGP